MKKILVLTLLALSLTACNTIQGMGEDLRGAGQGISNTSVKAKEKIDNM
jgi:predicted small secreted protein